MLGMLSGSMPRRTTVGSATAALLLATLAMPASSAPAGGALTAAGGAAATADGALTATSTSCTGFPDVALDDTHARAIAAIAEVGITTGRVDGTYDPAGFVTRAQMATFLADALELPTGDVAQLPFPDVDPGSVHAPRIVAIYQAGVTTGRVDGTYDPAGFVTRAQMATFLSNALRLRSYEQIDVSGSVRVLTVPGDHASIQAAIDAADDGDAVLVGPGTYAEQIDLRGREIIVTSSDGPEVTVIDADSQGVVVTATNGETSDTVLHGFTLTRGLRLDDTDARGRLWNHGGGVWVNEASPTLSWLIVENNAAVQFGGGWRSAARVPPRGSSTASYVTT